jgi:L-iditol 2-dehydrogenase
MKALQKVEHGKGFVEIRDVEKPEIANDDDVLIKVKAAGVCGTDIHIFNDEFTSYPPVTLGHEFSGVVESVGKGVTKFKKGDSVVAEPHSKACMVCDICRRGYWQICENKRSPGWGIDGAFTEYLIMPEKLIHFIPEGVSFDIAALAEPMAIVTNYVSERAKVFLQDVVVVVGAGPIGILAGLAAKENGASCVIMLGVDSDEKLRFKTALELGTDRVINVMREDAEQIISEMTKGRMADMVIEASGNEKGIQTAFNVVRKTGRICVIGLTGKPKVEVPWDTAQKKILDVFFNMSSSYTSWDSALSLMANTKYDLNKVITHKESIDNWEKVFDDILSGRAIKALFVTDEK